MDIPNLDFLKPQDGKREKLDTKIPPSLDIPDPSYLTKEFTAIPHIVKRESSMKEHAVAYEQFCRWASLPSYVRKPTTAQGFEKKWGLPKGYHNKFRTREDYQQKRTFYFYEWVLDRWPGAVDAAFKRAMKDSSADFKILADMIGKRTEVNRPAVNIAPMVIVGVAQEKIDKLFTPKGFENPPKIIQGEISK